jgi:hypothetical protein
MTWHVEPQALEAYAHETIDQVHAYSVEAHLMSCEACRLRIASLVDSARLDHVWSEIDAAVAIPQPGPIERSLLKLGVAQHVARLLAATPSLRLSWLLAVSLALALSVVTAYQTPEGYLLFLVVAPLLPLAGVAAAYGPGIDPTYEIGLAAPMRGFHLLLVRATAVLSSTMTLAAVAALLLPGLNWTVAAWLIPSVALSTASLALATAIHPVVAAIAVAASWIVVCGAGGYVAAESPSYGLEDLFGGQLQVALFVVAMASVALLIARSDEFERGEHR